MKTSYELKNHHDNLNGSRGSNQDIDYIGILPSDFNIIEVIKKYDREYITIIFIFI